VISLRRTAGKTKARFSCGNTSFFRANDVAVRRWSENRGCHGFAEKFRRFATQR
jgi:hypothetical protein